jgi:hypothetical protein
MPRELLCARAGTDAPESSGDTDKHVTNACPVFSLAMFFNPSFMQVGPSAVPPGINIAERAARPGAGSEQGGTENAVTNRTH